MRITERQFRVLRQLVLDHHAAFVANYISPSVLSEATLARLRALGLFRAKANAVRDAFVLGVLQAQARSGEPPQTYTQLKARMVAQPVPLSDAEREAVSNAQLNAGQYITALGGKVAGQVGQMVLTPPERLDIFAYQAERAARDQADDEAAERRAYADAVSDAVADRKAIGELKSDLGHATGDWTRDLERVANTELSSALNAGTAAAAAREHGPEVKVACIHSPDCCDACRLAYVERGNIPRIFAMAELQANGTNVGRRAADWLPVVPPMHPNCLVAGTPVLTERGAVPIERVQVGELVLTHLDRWQPVTRAWRTPYDGEVVELDLPGRSAPLTCTPNHRIASFGGWVAAGNLIPEAEVDGVLARLRHGAGRDEAGLAAMAQQAELAVERRGERVVHVELRLPDGQVFGADEALAWPPGAVRGINAPWYGMAMVVADDAVLLSGEHRLVWQAEAAVGDLDEPARLTFKVPTPPCLLTRAKAAPQGRRRARRTSLQRLPLSRRATGPLQVGERLLLGRPSVQLSLSPPTVALCPMRLSSVRRRSHRGEVFNLSVAVDESYVASNVRVGNCGCTMVVVPEGTGFNDDGQLVEQGDDPATGGP